MGRGRRALAAALCALPFAACTPPRNAKVTPERTFVRGNILRADYAGSADCANPRPLVRYYAGQALASILARKSPLDLRQDDAAVRAAAEAWPKAAATSH